MSHTNSGLNKLKTDAKGNIVGTISNFVEIIINDPQLHNIVYNELRSCIDVIGQVPWKRYDTDWNNADESCLELYLEQTYGIYAPAKCRDALYAILTTERRWHPIKEFLNSLHWDGKERLDTLLIDYLGADDTTYVRSVTRKTFVAAISRIINPGTKFDNVLVLCGAQGIGKSTLFSKLGGIWYSDSMTIADMKDKTAAEKLQGIWIMELGELAGLKKMDVEVIKSFLSRVDDRYRPTYGQCVESHLRKGIIVGTTNTTDGFLRDITGNRRFWTVFVSGNCSKKPWDISATDVEQIWAEALHRFYQNEQIFLTTEIELDATAEQRKAMESDPRQGIVEEYLNNNNKQSVCLMEIWCDCLGKERADMKRRDAYELESILYQIGDWTIYPHNTTGKTRIQGYGIQKTFIRISKEEMPLCNTVPTNTNLAQRILS